MLIILCLLGPVDPMDDVADVIGVNCVFVGDFFVYSALFLFLKHDYKYKKENMNTILYENILVDNS